MSMELDIPRPEQPPPPPPVPEITSESLFQPLVTAFATTPPLRRIHVPKLRAPLHLTQEPHTINHQHESIC